MTRRFVVIPDTQVRPGVAVDHLEWAARAILDYRPDVIVHLGDHWDMPSLSSHEPPGHEHKEGQRIRADIDAGNAAMQRFLAPFKAVRRRYRPRKLFLTGNHEARIERAIAGEPRWREILSYRDLYTGDFEVMPFLEIIEIDGISFSHYFANTHSGKPIGGSIDNRLARIGRSFVAGHEQGLLYGIKQYPGDLMRHGLVAGSFYQHCEHYRGPQGRNEWRGIVVLNEVSAGTYDVMPVSIGYLQRKYARP